MSFDGLPRGLGCICTPAPIKQQMQSIIPIKPMLDKDARSGGLPSQYDMVAEKLVSQTVRDQGRPNACAAFACCAALERLPLDIDDTQDESERFLYYQARHTDGMRNPDEDRGTYLASVIKVLQTKGSCWEESCPYDADPLGAPSASAIREASSMTASAYRLTVGGVSDKPGPDDVYAKLRFYLREAIKQVLYFAKSPVITAFKVSEHTLFDAGRAGGVLPLPNDEASADALVNSTLAHAVLIVGYDDSKQVFKFKNSYGAAWGDKGFGYMPYDYIEYTDDSYVITNQGYTPRGHGTATQSDTSSTCPRSLGDQLPPEWSRNFYVTGGSQPRDLKFVECDWNNMSAMSSASPKV